MTITNGYASRSDFLAYMSPTDINADTTDDPVVDMLVEAASRKIDEITQRTFYARTETHLFDAPVLTGFAPMTGYPLNYFTTSRNSSKIYFDDDLLSVTTLTNGDGSVIASANYLLYPANRTPKYAISLKDTTGVVWQADSSGSYLQCISLAGSWGYASTTPTDIHAACLDMAVSAYKARFGNSINQSATVTAAGIVLTPRDWSDDTRRTLQTYQRAGIA